MFGEHFANYHVILLHLIIAADKWIFYAVGTGDLRIEVPNGKSSTPIILKDVLCEGKVPGGPASEFTSSKNRGSPHSERDQQGTSGILPNLGMGVQARKSGTIHDFHRERRLETTDN